MPGCLSERRKKGKKQKVRNNIINQRKYNVHLSFSFQRRSNEHAKMKYKPYKYVIS